MCLKNLLYDKCNIGLTVGRLFSPRAYWPIFFNEYLEILRGDFQNGMTFWFGLTKSTYGFFLADDSTDALYIYNIKFII